MKKSRHWKRCWLLDDGILLHGYKDKYGFHPDKDVQCGFNLQVVKPREKNKLYFFSLKEAYQALGSITADVKNIRCSIDLGTSVLKMRISIDGIAVNELLLHTVISRTGDVIKDLTGLIDKALDINHVVIDTCENMYVALLFSSEKISKSTAESLQLTSLDCPVSISLCDLVKHPTRKEVFLF